jgi:endogenous inhibitor of DNA gyrase (YacG/DUF329 family)
MDFSFFTTNNKSGYKTQERWLSKNHSELYSKILNYSKKFNINLSFKEKIWFYYNNLNERPKCKTCGREIKFRNRFDKPYGEFCSLKCINENKEEMIKRQKKTFNRKYNVDFYPQHKEFIIKQRKTKLEKYGDENYNNLEQSKKTRLKKYGNENYNNWNQYKITCNKKYGVDNYSKSNNYYNKIIKNYKLLYPNINFINVGKLMVRIKCNECGKESELTKQLLYERNKRNYVICVHCNPIGQSNRSGHEIELSKFLETLLIPHKCSSKKELNGKELDIIIPDYNLAIEIDGVYWHNELFYPFDYHLKKTIGCQEKNIELIHIFEDEWVNKKEIVKSIIKNRLKKTDNSIFGRKCLIKDIDSSTCKKFLNENHIQGNVNSKVKIGLYYQDDLVSVMTFSKGRILMGGKSAEWELTRFCNKINTNVVGAAGKLFKYFINNYHPNKLISYSDIRLFNGDVYKNLGFKRKSQSGPNYWYVINGLRYYRFNFRKSILVKEGYDKNKTEKEIMFDRKIYRIYDCGHIRWEYNVL